MSGSAAPITGTAGGVSTDTSRLASRANLDAAGKRFEAIFINMMMKSMRQAKLADGLFESKAIDQFKEMQDTQFAQTMAQQKPLGLGKAMADFLGRAMPAGEGAAVGAAASAADAGNADGGTG
ncbi:rod-binding protein [Sphingomonas canadensis]|uniref:Rod-binding protein n=1 Tax=Sphingomonas canadensis TaxID=1219257 RepID=A0ABW3H199_9SPHN|nr:rod-binding protein [Sphingomonas canadensis]MCW3834849.1 rod-binding protein [Sphingomonas canadensis]